MVDKSFPYTILFHRIDTKQGEVFWIPVVTVMLIQSNGNRVQLPLLFDTGADVTTLRHDLYPLLGLRSWDDGQPVQMSTAGGPQPVTAYRYRARLEFLGKAVDCEVQLAQLPQNPIYVGLFGRAQIFEEFGFGFWERDHALYATAAP